jgi:hypothetical protein
MNNVNEMIKNVMINMAYSFQLLAKNSDRTYITAGGVGREKRVTVYCLETDIVNCGCYEGTLAQFETQVRQHHKDNPHHLKEYLAMIEYFKLCRLAQLDYPKKEPKVHLWQPDTLQAQYETQWILAPTAQAEVPTSQVTEGCQCQG